MCICSCRPNDDIIWECSVTAFGTTEWEGKKNVFFFFSFSVCTIVGLLGRRVRVSVVPDGVAEADVQTCSRVSMEMHSCMRCCVYCMQYCLIVCTRWF